MRLPDVTTARYGRLLLLIVIFVTLWCGLRHWQVLQPLAPGERYIFADDDSVLRMTQVRAWITLKDFYDHTIPHVSMSGGMSTPWTRPMDMLVAAPVLLMPETMTLDRRIMIAAAYVPGLLLIVYLVFLSRIGSKCLGPQRLRALAVMAVFCPTVFNYFMPGNVDHHALFATVWAMSLWALVGGQKSRDVTAGLLLAILLWISPEGLLPVFAVYALRAAENIKGGRQDIFSFFKMSLALTIGIAGALCAEVPLSAYLSSVAYDTLSIVHVFLFSAVTAALGLLTLAWQRWKKIPLRIFSGFVATAAVAEAMAVAFPAFFLGPMAGMSPALHARVMDVKDMQSLFNSGALFPSIAALPLLAGFLLWRLRAVRMNPQRRRTFVRLAFLFAITLLMTFWHLRLMYYAHTVAMIIVACYLPVVLAGRGTVSRIAQSFGKKYAAPVAVAFFFVGTYILASFFMPPPTKKDICIAQQKAAMHGGLLQRYLGPYPVTVLGAEYSDTLFFTPYEVVALYFMRGNEGIEDIAKIENAPDAKKARALLKEKGVDYLFICPVQYKPDSWLARPVQESGWITPVPGWVYHGTDGPQLYKVMP